MRCFAIIPAAGHSRRMGQPKLTMTWQGKPLIVHQLEAWAESDVEQVVVVVRRDDVPLARLCRTPRVTLVQPAIDPPDMKASIRHGLDKIRQDFGPAAEDFWLVAPADMPRLQTSHLNQVIHACRGSERAIVAPVYRAKRGHPVAFPWPLAAEVDQLPEDSGLNVLVKRHPVFEVPVGEEAVLTDVDTPEDFQQLTDRDQNP